MKHRDYIAEQRHKAEAQAPECGYEKILAPTGAGAGSANAKGFFAKRIAVVAVLGVLIFSAARWFDSSVGEAMLFALLLPVCVLGSWRDDPYCDGGPDFLGGNDSDGGCDGGGD